MTDIRTRLFTLPSSLARNPIPLSGWWPDCYTIYQNILPAPIVLLDKGILFASDADVLFDRLGSDFTDYLAAKGFDWGRLAVTSYQGSVDILPATT